jgi:MoaA/NifB/PqqE/SkfB family radical SAM enzyme
MTVRLAEARPSRVVLNFTHHCALRCEWCYVPFETPRAEREIVVAIVERIATLEFRSLTLGGGDPFQYPFVPDVIRRAKGLGLNVHVDTHGRSFMPSAVNAKLATDYFDLVGLPLDGPTATVHDSIRTLPGHFDLVLRRLAWLKSLGVRVKLNTMVSQKNAAHLPELAQLVCHLSPWRWSIYQFWPLGPAHRVLNAYEIERGAFDCLAGEAAKHVRTNKLTVVEISDQLSRRATYPLVHHDGSVFAHSVSDPNSFSRVCSIFDVEARELIDDYC